MYVDYTDIDGLVDALASIPREPDQWLMVLLADQTGLDVEILANALKDNGVPAFGGVFAALIADGSPSYHGAIGLPIPLAGMPTLVDAESTDLDSLPTLADLGDDPHTALLFYSQRDINVAPTISLAFDRWGPAVSYFGAGAGPASPAAGPCLFSDGQSGSACGLVAVAEARCDLSIRHGYTAVAGPVVATRCEGNLIHELNWGTAFEVYRRSLPQQLPGLSREDILKRFPLAIAAAGNDEATIRTIVDVTDEGALHMAASVPENATVFVSETTPTALQQAARAVVTDLQPSPQPALMQLLIACQARRKTLGDQGFADEIKQIQQQSGQALLGVAGLGEIASTGERFFEVQNKALALGRFYA